MVISKRSFLTGLIAAPAVLSLKSAFADNLDTIRNNLWMIDQSTATGVRTFPSGIIPAIYDFWMTGIDTVLIGSGSVAIHILNTPPGEHPAEMWVATNGNSRQIFPGGKLFPPLTQFAIEGIYGTPSLHRTCIMGILTPTNPAYWN